MPTPYVPKTQKARGIGALRATGYAVPAAIVKSARSVRLKPAETLEMVRTKLGSNVIGRSGPPVPNHGGVPSRKVTTADELLALANENLAYHKASEIIFMPYLDAAASAIWTPGLLTLGAGHDGATAAKEAIVLPVPKSESCDPFNSASAAAGITSWPYLEIVYAKPNKNFGVPPRTWFVQLRDGPKLPGPMADFIPTTMVVEKVLTVSENDIRDELAWARDLPLLTPGTVVYCHGAGLTSHYAVQCIALWKDGQPNLFEGTQPKAIPFITSREPIVGETLVPPPLTIPQGEAQAAIRRGYLSAWELEVPPKDAIVIGLLGLHAASALTANYHGAFFHGLAAGLLVRGTNLICRGELRYKTKVYATHSGWEDRNKVYMAYWPLKKVHLAAAQRVFAKASLWGSKSIGGFKWYGIANHAVATHNAIIKGEPFLESYNKLANAVHNCGWAFNKLVNSGELQSITSDPALSMVNNGGIIHSAMTAALKIENPKERRTLKLFSMTQEGYTAQIVAAQPKSTASSVPHTTCPTCGACKGCNECKCKTVPAGSCPSCAHSIASIGPCACQCHPSGHCYTCDTYEYSLANPGLDCKCECHGEGKKYAFKKAPVCSQPEHCKSHTDNHKNSHSASDHGKHPGPGLPLNGCTACSCSCHVGAVAPPPAATPVTPKAPMPVGPTVTQCKIVDNGALHLTIVHVQKGNTKHYDKYDFHATAIAKDAWNTAPKVKSLADGGSSSTPYALCELSDDLSTVTLGGLVIGQKSKPEPPKPTVNSAGCIEECAFHAKKHHHVAHAGVSPTPGGCLCECPCHKAKPVEKPAPKAKAKPFSCTKPDCVKHEKGCKHDKHVAGPNGGVGYLPCSCPCSCHPYNHKDGKPSCDCGCCDDSIPF